MDELEWLSWRIFSKERKQLAAFKYGTDAALFVSMHGDGTTVKIKDRHVWVEGSEKFRAENNPLLFESLTLDRWAKPERFEPIFFKIKEAQDDVTNIEKENENRRH